jgi:hypothetical protein
VLHRRATSIRVPACGLIIMQTFLRGESIRAPRVQGARMNPRLLCFHRWPARSCASGVSLAFPLPARVLGLGMSARRHH